MLNHLGDAWGFLDTTLLVGALAWIKLSARRAAKEAIRAATAAELSAIQSKSNAKKLDEACDIVKQTHEKVNGQTEARIAQAREEASAFQPARVLVIDDNDDDLELQAIVLRKCGCEVFQVKGGRDAERFILENIRAQSGYPANWIVLDLRLGAGETAKDVLAMTDRLVPNIPVVIVTGYPNSPELEDITGEVRWVLKKPMEARHVQTMKAILHLR